MGIIDKIFNKIGSVLDKIDEWDEKLNKHPVLKAFIAPIFKALLLLLFILFILLITVIICIIPFFGLMAIISLLIFHFYITTIIITIIAVYLICVRKCYKNESNLGID